MSEPTTRRLELTEELIRAYSRRGNYHSDQASADALGLPGLVAQGVQVVGPAYGVLLDAWGDAFLAGGELDVKFVGMVTAGQTVEARVAIGIDDASIEVVNVTGGAVAAVGTARRAAAVASPR